MTKTGPKNEGTDKAESSGAIVGTLEDSRAMQPAQPPLWGRSFADLLAGADVAQGGDLLKGEDPKADLIGIPFIITRLVFRDGVKYKDGGATKTRNYVSVEIMTADEATYATRAKFMPDKPAFPPNTQLVFNDGSTGVCREMVAYCHEKGYINVGAVDKTGGAMGESPFDRYRTEWAKPETVTEAASGKTPEVTVDVLFYCPRGLRVSEYENDFTSDDGAKTYYIG